MIQLPHPRAHAQIIDFMKPDFVAQLKLDGVRLALVYGEDCAPTHGVTKGGQEVGVPTNARELPRMPPGTVLDGELLGDGTWQSALASLRDMQLHRDSDAGWVCFDIIADPLQVAEAEEDGFVHRVQFLADRGFPVLPAGDVQAAWQQAEQLQLEGVVVRGRLAGPLDPAWKIKLPQTLNVLVHRGKAMLMRRTGQPAVVASMPSQQIDGVYRVSCEGVTTTGKLRAARIIGPAIGIDVSYDQLAKLRS